VTVDGKLNGLGSSTMHGRWAKFGPYYAMFPMQWAMDVVAEYSREGDFVLDPFAGRGSSIYAAAAQNRTGYGVEINPVGWLFGDVKLKPAPGDRVLRRVEEICSLVSKGTRAKARAMSEFFRVCYHPKVLSYLLAARSNLDWRDNWVDRTTMGLILVYLHGKVHRSLSNQMRDTKAMSPDYSVRWWRKNGYSEPPEIDPVAFLSACVKWRYGKGRPKYGESKVVLGDSTEKPKCVFGVRKRFHLMFTSPPYFGVTNYHYDQWLRLWMLGGKPSAARDSGGGPWRRKFESRPCYKQFLRVVFRNCTDVMADRSTIYVRTDAREFTREATINALQESFPGKEMRVEERPLSKPSQTALFGDRSEKPGECDIILR
jgi:hypothetical protein